MLARVAEHLYWLGRYIERAEDTSRLFEATINLMLDLPENSPLNWSSLVEAIVPDSEDAGLGEAEATEVRVSRWLLLDPKNPSSIRSCIKAARENARVARDQLPKDAWEGLNRIDLMLTEGSAVNLSRRKRSELLRQVIWGCRHFSGVLHGSMSRDEAWQ
ncbi:MAG: alpha-E domain-containing protein, partial [Litorivicinus sp.]